MYRISHHFSEIREKGLIELFRKFRVLRGMILEFTWFVCFLPIALVLMLIVKSLNPFLIIRFGYLISWRIGHYVGNTDMYLSERKNEINTNSKNTIDLWFERTKPCNSQFHIMLKRVLNIYPRWLLHPLYILNNLFPGEKNKIPDTVCHDRDILNLIYNSNKVSSKVANNISFSKEEEKRGKKELLKIGLRPESKFVCLIVRDSAYLKNQKDQNSSGVDWSYHDYRDTPIENYILAAEELTKHGYFVFRMGAVVNEPLNSSNKMIIDYAKNGMRSDFMDIYLGAKCDFCISSATGFDAIPSLFRKPKLTVNLTNVEYFHSFFSNDLTLTRKFKYKNNSELLSLNYIIESGIGRISSSEVFKELNLELIENTPEEIRDATIEMILRTSGKWNDDWYDKEIQPIIESIFSKSKVNGKIQSRFTTSFLKDNPDFLKLSSD